ncbi:cyclase family protein [Tomitella biformata]|uniref:cyclase family protein n=1 Tax=Tomitella biformata TaxID=630403 RepID=UPI0004667631|nr:cyclase family protein [Tomitella biformata]
MCGDGVTAHVYRQIARREPRTPSPAVPADDRPSWQRPPAGRVIDLTHVLNPLFPHWPGDRPFEMRPVSRCSEDDFHANELMLHEHSGTHVDAPAHVRAGALTVDAIAPADLVAPLVVIDIADRAAVDPDTMLATADILAWEAAHGPLPARCLVAMNSGWHRRVAAPGKFLNIDADGYMRTPGFDPAAAAFLAEQRDVVAIASDTLSVDAGLATDFGAHLAALGSGLYAVEALAHLDAVPAAGALVIVGAPRHQGGSGGPARVLAFV